jgi:hypothetical protein
MTHTNVLIPLCLTPTPDRILQHLVLRFGSFDASWPEPGEVRYRASGVFHETPVIRDQPFEVRLLPNGL